MKGGVFLGPARVSLQEQEATAEGVRMKGCRLDHRRHIYCSMCCTAHAFPFRVREKIVQYHRERAMSFQDLVRRLPHSTFLDPTTQTDAPDDVWEEKPLVGDLR